MRWYLLPMLVCLKFQGGSIEEKNAPQYMKHLAVMGVLDLGE